VQRFDRRPAPGIHEWLGTESDARLIVTVGKNSPRKGQDHLVRAMPKVIKAEPRARLVIVGEHTDSLRPLIGELGVSDQVILTGGIAPTAAILANQHGESTESDHLADILCSSEVYVSAGTERNAEGLSLAVLEAMAASLPIVATAISGNVDVVVDGENGYLTEPADSEGLADAIIRVLQNSSNRCRMRDGARSTALRYSWDNVAHQYLEVYAEAIAETRASG
jgi:glycosyltransferase involved in cell wall biosynthesis